MKVSIDSLYRLLVKDSKMNILKDSQDKRSFLLSGYLDQGLMVKDPKLLRKNYLKTPFFYLDVISILPTDIAYFFVDTKCVEQVPCLVIGIILAYFNT